MKITALQHNVARYWLLFAIIKDTVNTQDLCGAIGTSNERYGRDGSEGFYLNTDNPAPYSGFVTRWYYCHYIPYLTFAKPRQTTFAVFRRTYDGFERVSEPTLIQENYQQLISLGERFECNNFRVSPGIPVQEGDILGACIYDFLESSHELNIVGNNASQDFRLLFANGLDCKVIDRLIPSYVTNDMVMQVSSRVMHLYAEIECPPPQTDATTEPINLNIEIDPTNSEGSSSPPKSDTLFVLQIAGILGGLIVAIVLLVVLTICIIVCCVQPKVKSDTHKQNKQRKTAYRDSNRTMAATNKGLGLRTFTTHTDRPEEREEAQPVYTVINNLYQKTNVEECDQSGNTYSYPSFHRVVIQ